MAMSDLNYLIWARLLDGAAAYIVERQGRRAIFEQNWLLDYDALRGDFPTLEVALRAHLLSLTEGKP